MTLILMADDDELVVDVVREALAARGHIVGAVDDGLNVIDVVEFKNPDLVILDCSMPEVCGIEALRQIRASSSHYATPVLMLTGRRSKADEEIALRAGANDYLRKPVDPDLLVSRVETLIVQAEARRAPARTASRIPNPDRRRQWGQR